MRTVYIWGVHRHTTDKRRHTYKQPCSEQQQTSSREITQGAVSMCQCVSSVSPCLPPSISLTYSPSPFWDKTARWLPILHANPQHTDCSPDTPTTRLLLHSRHLCPYKHKRARTHTSTPHMRPFRINCQHEPPQRWLNNSSITHSDKVLNRWRPTRMCCVFNYHISGSPVSQATGQDEALCLLLLLAVVG